MHKSFDYVSDYELESACKDAPCVAPSRVNCTIFAVLVVRVHHVVLTRSFKLFYVFYIYICCFMVVGWRLSCKPITLILYSNFEIFVTVVTGLVGLRQITMRS